MQLNNENSSFLKWKKKTHTGPSHWGEQYNTCFGKYQSPIDIDSLNVKHINLKPLIFNGLDLLPNQTIIKNNGHTGKILTSFLNCHK